MRDLLGSSFSHRRTHSTTTNSTEVGSSESTTANPIPTNNPPPPPPIPPTTIHPLMRAQQRLQNTTICADVEATPKDNDYVGDPLRKKDPNHTRILFGNVRGLSRDNKMDRMKDLMKDISMMSADIVGFAEINIDDSKPKVSHEIHDSLRANFEHYGCVSSTSSIPSENIFKPGGTFAMAHGDVVGRIKDKGSDPYGRWSYMKFIGSGNKLITFISAYQVCENRNAQSSDGMTAYNQQQILLREAGHSNIDPRKHFFADLKSFLKKLKTEGSLIILCGDFNQELCLHPKKPMLKLCNDNSLRLVDVLGCLHPDCQDIRTYDRGSKRIDYALISPELVPMVTVSGYLPFYCRIVSDHRFFYLDFNTQALLGDPSKLASLPERDIRSKDPTAVTTYVRAKHKHLCEQNFFKRIDELDQLENPDPRLAENLDGAWTQASIHAGKKCRRFRRAWWSTALAKAVEKVKILNIKLANLRKNIDVNVVTNINRKYVDPEYTPPDLIADVKKELKCAQKDVVECRNNGPTLRDKGLELQAEVAAMSGDSTKEQNLKQLRHQEQTNIMWRSISRAKGESRSNGIVNLEIPSSWPSNDSGFNDSIENPKQCNQWKQIQTPKAIEFYLRKRNQIHFGQAHGTPFTVPPLSVALDWSANSLSAELMLEGEYESAELDNIQQMLINHCKGAFDPLQSQVPLLTTTDWKRRIKRWKERTTTSPSGMHLGHARALIARHSLDPSTVEGKELTAMQEDMIAAQVKLQNYAVRHRHSYQRWKQIVNVMIEKDPGNPKIHRLRVIHLYEYDLGMLLAIHWKNMLRSAEKRNEINEGQYGGRAGHEAQSLVFLEEVKNEICHFSRKSLINFDNDAASCYDRIIPALASLLGRKHGLHRNITYVHATTLQEAKYKLKTSLGISDESYQHEAAFPIYGTGQGSTNSPVIWIIVSSALFDIHNQHATGATFCSPDKSMSISFSIVGFVDDSNCQTNNFLSNNQSNLYELCIAATADAQLWSDLLWTSGGFLELPKCSYHMIHFEFDENGAPHLVAGVDEELAIQINDSKTQQPISIPQKSNFECHKTLGHLKCPGGTQNTQVASMKKTCDRMARQIFGSSLHSNAARSAYDQVLMPKVGYILPQCFMSTQQLTSIESEVQRAFAAKCGYNRNMALDIRYGPKELGGAGFVRFEVLQAEGQISNFLKHWRTDTMISDTLKATLAWAQLSAGLEEPILEFPGIPIPYLEGRLFKSMRASLVLCNGSIEVDNAFVPAKQREHDEYIMKIASEWDKISPKQLSTINYCRLYLQAVTTSDLALPCGRKLDKAFFKGDRSVTSSSTKWLHVNQDRPHGKAWRLWTKFMTHVSQRLNNKPLGNWTLPADELRREWPAYLDEVKQYLFVRTCDGYKVYTKSGPLQFAATDSTAPCPTPTSYPVKAIANLGDTWTLLHRDSLLSSTPVSFDPSSFESFVSTMEDWEKPLLSTIDWSSGPFEIAQTFDDIVQTGRQLELTVVGDGSVSKGSMSFGWAIAIKRGPILVQGSGPAFGAKDSSFRAEGYALLSVSRFLLRLAHFCEIHTPWDLSMFSDNKGLVSSVNSALLYDTPYPNTTLGENWDIINSIRITIQLLHCKHSLSHVKGHQDDATDFRSLPQEAQLNVHADKSAGDFRKAHPFHRPRVFRLLGNRAQFHVNGSTISGKVGKVIRREMCQVPLLQRIQQRYQWSDRTMESIDFKLHASALKSLPHRAVQLTKLCHEIMPTNKMMHRYDPCTSDKCPRCNSEVEDLDHFLRCPHPDRKVWEVRFLRNLATYCNSKPCTSQALLDVLIQGLSNWLQITTSATLHDGFVDGHLDASKFPDHFLGLITAQNSIGWGQLFRGRVSNLWVYHHDQYVSEQKLTDVKNSGSIWMKQVILQLWDHLFALWENRNQLIHGSDSSNRASRRKTILRHSLHAIHQKYRPLVIQADLVFFLSASASDDTKIDEFVDSHGPTFIQNWINTYRPFFAISAKAAIRSSASGTRPITDFFVAMISTSFNAVLRRTVRRDLSETMLIRATSAKPKPRKKKKPPDLSSYPSLPTFFNR